MVKINKVLTLKNYKKLKWRVLDLWHEPGGDIQLSNEKNFLTIEDMINTDSHSKVTELVQYAKSLGFNAIYSLGNPDNYPEAAKKFSLYLKKNGMGYIIWRTWNEYFRGMAWLPDVGGYREKIITRKNCPFNPKLKTYWQERAGKDFKMMPGLVGYRMVASQYYCVQGAPWLCNCKKCQSMSEQDRLIAGMELLGNLLMPYNGTIFWETVLDDPWDQKMENELFANLTEKIPDNVFAVVKETIWDYNVDWPRPPMFDTITKDAEGHSPYITSFIISGDYRGTPTGPWSLLDQWKEAFEIVERTGQQGVWFQTAVGYDRIDHPLNMVNWYAASRYMENPHEEPDKIMQEWTEKEFGRKSASVIIKIIKKMTEALHNVLYYKGLWTQNHGRYFSLLYLEGHFCGPYKLAPAVNGMFGLELPLDFYPPEKAKKIKEEERTLAVFNRIPLTEETRQDILRCKAKAVVLIQECIELLKDIKNEMEGKTYDYLIKSLTGYKNDAILWKAGMELYLDWKMGKLTEDKIDEVLESCKGLRGIMLPNPYEENPKDEKETFRIYPATLATFANDLKQELRKPNLKNVLTSETLW